MPSRDDHDQRFKELIRVQLPSLLAMRFPDWVERFDFTRVDWLSEQVFLDPPGGGRRAIDLLVKVPVKRPLPGPARQVADSHVALVHVEIENTDPLWRFQQRLFEYRTELSKRYAEPILPLVVFLHRKLDGLGWHTYQVKFWEEWIVQFRYPYIAVPGLNAMDCADSPNLLSAALTTMMGGPEPQVLEVRARALRRILESDENERTRYLLAECFHAYSNFSAEEWRAFQELLMTPRYREVGTMTNA